MSTPAAYTTVRPRPAAGRPVQLLLDVVGLDADGTGVPVVSLARRTDAQVGAALPGLWPRCMGRDAQQHLTVGARRLWEIAAVIGTPFLVRDAAGGGSAGGGPTVVVLRLDLAALDSAAQHLTGRTGGDEGHRQVDGNLVAVSLGDGTPSSSRRTRR